MMLMAKVNTAKSAMWISQKISTSKGLCQKINTNVALPMFRMLQVRAPVFRGLLRKQMIIQATSTGNVAISWIRFPTADPDSGKPYAWYAENGRGAIHGKVSPRMRYFASPENKLMYKDSPGLVFRTDVAAAHPSFFIRDTLAMHRGIVGMIASKEVAAWVRI